MTASLIIPHSAKEIVSGEAPPTEVMSEYFVSAEYLFFSCLRPIDLDLFARCLDQI